MKNTAEKDCKSLAKAVSIYRQIMILNYQITEAIKTTNYEKATDYRNERDKLNESLMNMSIDTLLNKYITE